MRSITRVGVVAVLVVAWMLGESAYRADACTSAVVSPEASVTGTPVLWKNRDTPVLSNKVVFIDESPYSYLCLANAHADSGRSCWAGLNGSGFAIMNTATYNVPIPEGEVHNRQGIIMADALRICRTVDDFERYLTANLGPELGGKANFGVIDADGGAALFEVHNHAIERMDADDQPRNYLVNTNYARTGADGKGEGYLRFTRATELFDTFPAGGVDPQTILHRFSRDLDNPLVDEPSLTDAATFSTAEPVWITSRDCIDRPLTASAVVFVGGSAERPATMWVIPGEPVTAVAIPLWVEAGRSPEALFVGDHAPMWQASRRIKDYIRPSSQGHTADYLDLGRLNNADGTGYLPALLEMEAAIFDETEAFLVGGPNASDLADFQDSVAKRALAHLETIDIPDAAPQPEDESADVAACSDHVAAFERLAAESATVEMRAIGRSIDGDPMWVVEISGGGESDSGAKEPLRMLLPCGLGELDYGDSFKEMVDALGLEDDEFDRMDVLFVPNADTPEEEPE